MSGERKRCPACDRRLKEYGAVMFQNTPTTLYTFALCGRCSRCYTPTKACLVEQRVIKNPEKYAQMVVEKLASMKTEGNA
jgi:hypothetical protein